MKKLAKGMCKALLALFLVLLSGCGGGGNSLRCNYTIAFHGDSMTQGYVEVLRKTPLTPYTVSFEPGRDTPHDISLIDSGYIGAYIEKVEPDIFVFNSGVWDIRDTPSSRVNIRDYERNLNYILSYYLNNVDNVVFMYTLYGESNSYNVQVSKYNEVAKGVVDSLGVMGFDPNILEYSYTDGLHLDTRSNVLLAELFNTFIAAEFVCLPF